MQRNYPETGPVSYKVALTNGVTNRRHVDHLKQRHFIPSLQLDNPAEVDGPISPEIIEEVPTSTSVECESKAKPR